MERKEFEQVLKRALELQSLKKTTQEQETFNTEDLQSAADRLGISADILEQALKDTRRQQKKFHLSGTPDEVREAFLKHFLMNESVVHPGHASLKVDHDSIKTGSGGTIRVYHQLSQEIDALVEFSKAPEGGTNISWKANTRLPLRTSLLILLWPLLILIPMLASMFGQGQSILPIIPIAIIFFSTTGVMQWGTQNNANGLERSLENYFQNCQTIDELEAQKQLKGEIEELRKLQQQQPASNQEKLARMPIPELHEPENDDSSSENIDESQKRPGNNIKTG